MDSRRWRLAFLGLVALSVACSGRSDGDRKATAGDAPPEAAATPTADRTGEVPLGKRLADIGALTDLIVAEANDLPRAEFDPGALVAVIGKDPETIFAWVRDRTYWVPYRGLLRGARGVMLDRLGSNLDRAVLLGDLLRRAGYTVRLAHATLPEARARELLGKVRPIPAQRRAPVAPQGMPAARRRVIAALMPGFEKETEGQLAASRRVAAEAEALVRSQSETLLAAVRDAASPDTVAEGSATIAALRDHWWVEREDGGKWVAMDVLLPEAKAGEALIAASGLSDWKDAAPAIPESDWHSVLIRVVVERYEAGATKESTVLEALLRPAEELERQITFGHMPVPWPDELPDTGTSPQALRDAALAVREWVPFLRRGDEVITQAGFTIGGDPTTDPLERRGDISKVGGAEVAGGMDMALGGFGAEEALPAATAEWLDYEVRVPGIPPERLRRPVFDLLGPARRTSKATDFDGTANLRKLERFEALFSQTDILLQPCDFSGEFIDHLALSEIVANQAALREISRETDPAKVRALASEILGRMTFWGPLPDLALWRSALGSSPADGYLDRPNVLNYRMSQMVVNVDRPTFRQVIDIASNATGARRSAGGSSFESRLRQGVADTVAEMLALGSELRMAENTASVFAQLAAEGSRGLLIAAQDQSAVKALPWPEDEAMRVGADVGAGFMAVVPRRAVMLAGQQRVGWWRVHPTSGETIGVMDTGYHAAAADNTISRARVALRVLKNFEKANRRYMRTVLHNPNSFPNSRVQLFRKIYSVLRDAERAGL